MTPLIEVEGLTVKRDSRLILDIEHLTVSEREVLAVIGPNGAGKSTLLLAISRLLKPDGGRILFRGQPMEAQNELSYRRRIGLVLQEPLLLDGTVFDNIAMGLRFRHMPHRQVAAQANEWMTRLGIAHLKNRSAHQLSGGEAQRVSLARAFALQPELLLLDEPFSALDAPTRARLLEDLRGLLLATSVTAIFITHDLDEALLLGDRVAVLLQGRLRQVGSPEEVFTAPADREVAAFVGVETVVVGQVTASYEGRLFLKAAEQHLEAVGDVAVGRQVLLCLRPEDVTIMPEGSPISSSARNRLRGRILRLIPQGPLVRVVLDCGFQVVALITRASAQEMELAVDQAVTATFKASAIHLIPR